MRTLDAKNRDDENKRYASELPADLDPTTERGAKQILRSTGGKKAAQITLAELWKQSKTQGQGWLPTARLSAPLRVLQALEALGVVDQANDHAQRETVALRFRLTELGLQMALAAIESLRAALTAQVSA